MVCADVRAAPHLAAPPAVIRQRTSAATACAPMWSSTETTAALAATAVGREKIAAVKHASPWIPNRIAAAAVAVAFRQSNAGRHRGRL